MADFAPFNLGQALQSSQNLAVNQMQLEDVQRQRANRSTLQGMLQRYQAGDVGAAQQAAAIDPQATAQFMQVYKGLDEMGRQKIKERTSAGAKLAIQVLQTPEPLRPQVYARVRQQAADMGIDVGNLPTAYTPQLATNLESFVNQASELSDLMRRPETEEFGQPIEVERGGKRTLVRFGKSGREQIVPGSLPQKPGETGGADIKDIASLRKEYVGQAKDFQAIRDAYQNVQTSAAQDSATGDMSLIFAYMKMLDPQSVVREGEFATAQNAAGVPDRVQNIYNRAISGERLTSNQRKEFVSTSKALYDTRKKTHGKTVSEYRRLAQLRGINPEEVIVDFSADEEQGAPPVRAGAQPASAQEVKFLGFE